MNEIGEALCSQITQGLPPEWGFFLILCNTETGQVKTLSNLEKTQCPNLLYELAEKTSET